MIAPGRSGPIVVTTLWLLAASFLLAACDRPQERGSATPGKKLIVTVTPWPASAAVYVARQRGFFLDEGLDVRVEPYLSGHLGLAAVLSGKADLATVGETPIARAALDAKPLAVVATLCEADRMIRIIARKDRGIAKAEDLKGRRVALTAGTTAEFYLDILLTTSSIDPRAVRIVDLPPDGVVRALINGEVDAASIWSPHTAVLLRELGRNGTVLDEPGLYTMTWNAVASKGLSQRDPDAIARFLRAIVRANRFIEEDPASARAVTAKECGMDIPAVERDWSHYKFTAQLDQSLLLYLEDQARWMIRKKPSAGRKAPDFRRYIDARALSMVRPKAVGAVGD
jgi:NitT/TauT family transport system substrate-binding protein